jgi:hypothetical protein
MNKRVTAIGLTAGLLAGAGAGLILEMSGNAGAASNAAVITVAPDDTSSSSTGTDAAAPTGDHTARLQEVLQPLVADGTLTQDQLDKVITTLESAGPVGGPNGGPGGGPDGGPDGGPGRGHRGPGMGMGGGLDTVASVLGLTADEVRTAVEGGQTIAQLAEANGSSAQAVIDALVAEVTAHFDEEVAAGEHTQEDADARIADATTRITDMVNNTPAGGLGGPGGPGGRGHGPGGMDGDIDTPTTAGA